MMERNVEDVVLDVAEEAAPVLYLPDGKRLVFPGCHAKRVSATEIEAYEGRFEYWHGPTETLIVADDDDRIVSGDHELPAQYLAQLTQQLADECGAHFIAFGTTSIWQPTAQGGYESMVRPDQCLYLRPQEAVLPDRQGLKLGVHTLPDVVLEVDHTTDIRQGKLQLYESWRFPELWVEVPEAFTPYRQAGSPGLTIRVWERGGYREVEASRAFAGWTAAEIHAALNERQGWSAATFAALVRVGQALTKQLGTAGPEGTPRLSRHRAEGRAQGRAQGHAEGRVQGHAEGRVQGRVEGERALLCRLAARRFGDEVAEGLARLLAGWASEDLAHVGDWIVECASGDELLRRVRQTS